MNLAVGILALLLTANPPRRRESLSVDTTRPVALGAALSAAALIGCGAVATPLIDALDVDAPNLRIGVGIVLALVGIHDLIRRPPRAGAALRGDAAAIVPVFFPVLFRPDTALMALALGADHGVAATSGASIVAMAAVVGWHALALPHVDRASFRRVELGLSALNAAVLVVLAITIAADGVFAI